MTHQYRGEKLPLEVDFPALQSVCLFSFATVAAVANWHAARGNGLSTVAAIHLNYINLN